MFCVRHLSIQRVNRQKSLPKLPENRRGVPSRSLTCDALFRHVTPHLLHLEPSAVARLAACCDPQSRAPQPMAAAIYSAGAGSYEGRAPCRLGRPCPGCPGDKRVLLPARTLLLLSLLCCWEGWFVFMERHFLLHSVPEVFKCYLFLYLHVEMWCPLALL